MLVLAPGHSSLGNRQLIEYFSEYVSSSCNYKDLNAA
jgi:hypothetical protein